MRFLLALGVVVLMATVLAVSVWVIQRRQHQGQKRPTYNPFDYVGEMPDNFHRCWHQMN